MAESYHNYSEDDPQAEKFRKLFLGGLNYETSEEIIKQYFEQWGNVVDCVVMKNPETKKSRGFGFITYETSEMLDAAQANRPHKLDNRDLDTKRAMPRHEAQTSVKKIFVGGLKTDTPENDIMEVFGHFGNIEKLEIITDKGTGKRRGFCFITFDDFDSVDKCVLKRRILLNGNYVEVKKAFTKDQIGSMAAGRGSYGGTGGRRGFGGGYNEGYYQGNFGYPGIMGAGGWSQDYSNGGNQGGPAGDMGSCYGGSGFGGNFNNGYDNFGSGYVSGYGGEVAGGASVSESSVGIGRGMRYRR